MNICLGYEILTAHIDDTLDTRSNRAWKKWKKGLHEQVKVYGYKDVNGYLHSIESDVSCSYRRSTVHSDVVHGGLKNVSNIRAVSSLQCISFVIHSPSIVCLQTKRNKSSPFCSSAEICLCFC